MTPIFYSPEALGDMQEILDFLSKQDPKLLHTFAKDYQKALRRVREFPQAWPKVGRKVRVKIISKGFLYGIYYQYSKKTIFVGAVIQLTRRRSGWMHRFRP